MFSYKLVRSSMAQQLRRVRCSSVTSSTKPTISQFVTVTEYPASEHAVGVQKNDRKHYKRATVYIPVGASAWKKQEPHLATNPLSSFSLQDYLYVNVISHFLPAQYPHSVQPEYAKFTSFCFAASVAGSAGMVLSTQTLLLAVGVVGSHQMQTAGIMAGALNWVFKDGVGQLGGVWFASRMGHTKRFDTHPKKWRMTAALALDAAALMEILSPFAASWVVLPVACAANVLKNIGFLTASASRAALHQSIALNNNLADVTVKAGTQSMAAGLVGTGVGLGLSTMVLNNDPSNFVLGFCFLSATHLGCNYMAMRYVSLDHFNRQRLDLVLEEYFESNQILTPRQVARREQYLPIVKDRDSSDWLSIGTSLQRLAPNGANQLDDIRKDCPDDKYVISSTAHDNNGSSVILVFLDSADAEDLIRGMYHAYILRQQRATGSLEDGTASIRQSYIKCQDSYDAFRVELEANGWRTHMTNIEPPGSCRLAID
ncbi:hypothetical protein MPSEU_000432400 [Mayamaea pseudoterrestris]|nr:hypothetical protein MPSEU_000432400 [Mayamaea pseudoterrestris]